MISHSILPYYFKGTVFRKNLIRNHTGQGTTNYKFYFLLSFKEICSLRMRRIRLKTELTWIFALSKSQKSKKFKSLFFSQDGWEWAQKPYHATFPLICYSGDACPLSALQPDLLALIRQPSPSHHRGRHSGLVHQSTARNMDNSGPVDQPYSGLVHKRTAINMDNSGPVVQRTASMMNIHSVKVHQHTGRNMDPVMIQCISALLETRTPFLSSASGIAGTMNMAAFSVRGTCALIEKWPIFKKKFCLHFRLVHQRTSRNMAAIPEMEFLDINLTKDSSLLLHAIHSPFYWRILKKTLLFLVFKILTKNPRNKKTQVNSWTGFCRTEKFRVDRQTKTHVWEDSSLCPETSTKNVVQEFHLCVIRQNNTVV